MKLNEKLIACRNSKDMSQEEVAERLNVTSQTVANWEEGKAQPDVNTLIEIAKLFEISLEKLTNNSNVSSLNNVYKESPVEKNNKKISIRIFAIGIMLALILCTIGVVKQNMAEKTNEERAQLALEQSQNAINNANARLQEIAQEIEPLKQQYEAKNQEAESLNMLSPDWFAKNSQLQREINNIYSQISTLELEQFKIQNADYRVFYQLVEPITYNIFYYIGAGVFGVASLIALIYFLVTRKK